MFARTFLATATFVAVALVSVATVVVVKSGFEVPSFTKPIQQFVSEQRQIKCLANNIYYESGNQPIIGMMGVAYTTMNRVQSGIWPEDVCEVVYQRSKTLCQFSWVCEKTKSPNQAVWEQSIAIARHVWYKYNPKEDPTHGATYFHATYVRPEWKYTKTVQLGDHIFYK